MKQTKKERTQKEIIEAAKGILHVKGHEAITVRYLAEVTGYSHTNLYYYFKDMNELLWVLRIDMIEEMIADLTSVTFNKADPIEEILDAFFCYLDYFFKHPNVFRFFYFYPFIQLGEDDRFHQIEQRFQGILQKSFKRLIQEGVIQPENVQIVAKTIIYALLGMIMLSFSSNGSLQNKDIKVELTTLLGYLLKKNNATN